MEVNQSHIRFGISYQHLFMIKKIPRLVNYSFITFVSETNSPFVRTILRVLVVKYFFYFIYMPTSASEEVCN